MLYNSSEEKKKENKHERRLSTGCEMKDRGRRRGDIGDDLE